ncbi:MAG: hypothetical protein ACI9ND_000152, partial [Yoonia sp.]
YGACKSLKFAAISSAGNRPTAIPGVNGVAMGNSLSILMLGDSLAQIFFLSNGKF